MNDAVPPSPRLTRSRPTLRQATSSARSSRRPKSGTTSRRSLIRRISVVAAGRGRGVVERGPLQGRAFGPRRDGAVVPVALREVPPRCRRSLDRDLGPGALPPARAPLRSDGVADSQGQAVRVVGGRRTRRGRRPRSASASCRTSSLRASS
jgi:hypothetical protein